MPTIPPMPKLEPGFLGPQAQFKEYQLNVFSHTNSIIRLFNGNQVCIRIGYTYPTLMDFRLTNADTGKDGSKYIYKEIDDNEQIIKFNVTLPKKGSWKLLLYAQICRGQTYSELKNVFNYLLICTRISKKAKPFPRQHKDWSQGYALHCPNDIGPDKAGKEVAFSLAVPDAFAVAVVVAQEWTELTRMSQDSSEWSGKVFIPKKLFGYGERLTINVKIDESSPSYPTVLEYIL